MANDVEVVDATTTDVVLYDPNLFPELKWQDPQDMGKKLGQRMGQAKDLDDLFDALQGSSTKNMIGRKVEVHDVDFFAYQADDGVIPQAIAQAVDLDSGEVIEFATTSAFCTAFLRRAQLLELFPLKVRITEKVTRSGQKAINFERA